VLSRIKIGHDGWELCTGSVCSNRERASYPDDVELLNWLPFGRPDQSLILFLRGVHFDPHPDLAFQPDDRQVIEELRRALASGAIHICREQSGRKSSGGSAMPPPAKAEDQSRIPKSKTVKKTWVEFEVVDMEGNPAAGRKYLVMLPDGSLHEGTLGKTGVVRFENIDPETCVFSLPDLDREAWERV
jgi:hypothetical protein